MEVKEVRHAVQFTERFRHLPQCVVPEIEHSKLLEGGHTFGNLGESVFVQYQGLEAGLIPDRFGHLSKPLFPQVQMASRRSQHKDASYRTASQQPSNQQQVRRVLDQGSQMGLE